MKVEKTLMAIIAVVLVISAVIFVIKMTGASPVTPESPATVAMGEGDASLVVVGIKGLEKSLVERLSSEGRLPNIAALIAGGSTGTLETLGRNVDAKITWTSLVTGMKPENQGVGGTIISRRGEVIDAPLKPQFRTVPALWTIAGEQGESSGVVCWPGTWPVEEIDGVMVGNHSTYVLEREHNGEPADGMSPLSVHERLDPLMLETDTYSRRDLSRFINVDTRLGREALMGQNQLVLSTSRATDRSAVDVAYAIADDPGAQNLFVCLPGLDAVSQRFWHYMDTEAIERVDVGDDERRLLEGQVETLGVTVELYYEFIDELVGELTVLASSGGTVVIVGDHGYSGIPLDSAGMPLVGANMHSEEGMWVASGPRVASGAKAHSGALIDVAPTIMAAAGFPLPPGLDGKVHDEVILN